MPIFNSLYITTLQLYLSHIDMNNPLIYTIRCLSMPRVMHESKSAYVHDVHWSVPK